MKLFTQPPTGQLGIASISAARLDNPTDPVAVRAVLAELDIPADLIVIKYIGRRINNPAYRFLVWSSTYANVGDAEPAPDLAFGERVK